MNIVLFMSLLLSSPLWAHDHHEADLKAKAPLSGASVFQLESSWKNQRGERVGLTDLKGKPRLLAMLFTRCETACPLIVEDLKDIARDVAEGKQGRQIDVSIFSLDSFRESPESLRAFSEKRKLPAHWELYTSNADAVAELAAALGVRYKRLPDGDFIHSNVIYFLDGGGEVVAQKEGIKSPRADFVKRIRKGL